MNNLRRRRENLSEKNDITTTELEHSNETRETPDKREWFFSGENLKTGDRERKISIIDESYISTQMER